VENKEKETKQNNNTKEKKNTRKLNLGDFIVPAASGIIFLLVLFFILIPSIESTGGMLNEIKQIEKDQEILRRNIDVAKGIDFAELQKNLANARKVLPKRLEVAEFAYYIDQLAQEKELGFRELKAGDVAITTEQISSLEVKGVRVPMGYRGDYDKILDFFNELQLVSPYVISFGHKVELNQFMMNQNDPLSWALEIDVTGYYVEEDSEQRSLNLLVPIRPYDYDPNLVAEFENRVKKIVDSQSKN
jgi:Tfp pilus assembly protein PilO